MNGSSWNHLDVLAATAAAMRNCHIVEGTGVPTSDLTVTLRPAAELRAPAADEPAYLLVLEAKSSSRYDLPSDGTVTIGRAEECDLRLVDASTSRRHARVTVDAGAARVEDLGSHNGTRVNGEPVTGERELHSGDAISICETTLVYNCPSAVRATRPVLQLPAFRERLEDELERALRYQRRATLIAVRLPEAIGNRRAVADAATATLRLMDAVAWEGAAGLLVLLPELARDEGALVARGLATALERWRPVLGVATCPDDGCDVDALLAGARDAAAHAAPGQIRTVDSTAQVLELGEHRILIADPAMLRLFALIERIAHTELPVLVHGETGVGKESAAAAVHYRSKRAGGKLVAINCAALPETLVESELFGHARGAFSGATAAKPGLLETASGGTVFLDEVGELPLPVQAKLLRALDAKRFTRVGDVRERELDIRIVAATNRDLRSEVESGRFREDLYFRLSGATVVIPPLRDRRRELALLVRELLARACARAGRPSVEVSPRAMETLARYRWPGNVRELGHVLEFAVAAVDGACLEVWHLPEQLTGCAHAGAAGDDEVARDAGAEDAPRPAPPRPQDFRPIAEEIRDLERARMKQALEACDGVQTRAAQLLGMPRRTFVTKLKEYRLQGVGRSSV